MLVFLVNLGTVAAVMGPRLLAHDLDEFGVDGDFGPVCRTATGARPGRWRGAGARGPSTIVRSFWSIALCLPTVIVPVDDVLGGDRHSGGRGPFCRPRDDRFRGRLADVRRGDAPPGTAVGRAERWGRFIVVWNWCNVIEGVLVVVGGIPGTLGRPGGHRSGL